MCDFFGRGNKPSTSTTPTYTPPAQVASNGPATAQAPGVQIKGAPKSAENSLQRARIRRTGGSDGQSDTTSTDKKRRSASSGLGL